MKTPTFTQNSLLRLYLPYLVMSVVLTMLVYTSVQQSYRQSANDPQIQLAEDTATALDRGEAPASLVPARTVDMAQSLAPFIIITDENRQVLASSGTLDGATVLPPAGVFDATKADLGKDTARAGENRITWQPRGGVRLAAVMVHRDGHYVIAARNLREVEIRESQLTQMTSLAFIALLVAGLILLLILR